MHSQCRTKTLHVKMSLLSQTSRFPRAYNNTERSRPSSRQSHRFSIKTPIPQVKEGVTKVYWIFKLLSKLHTMPFRTTFSVLQTPQRNLQILRTHKLGRSLHQPQQTSEKFLPISIKTSTEK